MKRTSVFLLFLLLLSFPAFAQCVLTGKVVNGQENTPVEFANVAIYTHDSAFVVGGATNRLGEFRLSKVEAGDYFLQVSCVGFRTLRQSVVCGEGRIELGTMHLQTDTQELEEAHATADLRQADRLFVYPAAQQLKFSHNGIDLLMNLQLHRLWIDPVKRSIEALDGGKVGFLINGQPAEQADIQALHPKYILRVKYIDRPGLRYKDYAVVINYVTKAKEGSGLLAAQAEHMFRFHTGNALLMGKFYRKRAEAGFNYQMTYQTNATNDYYQSERYAFAPDSTVTYEWQDAGIDYKTRIHQGQIYYTNREEDKYYFNATLRLQYAGQPYHTLRLQGSTPEGKPVGEKERYISQDFYAPSLELYYDRHLSGNQFLAFNAVGTYMTNTTQNSFTNLHDTVLLSQGGTRQDIDRYSWIGEGYYEKSWGKTSLSAGIKNTWSRTESHYRQPAGMQVTQKENLAEAWAEIAHQNGKWSQQFSAGIYNQRLEENGKARRDWSYKLMLDLGYQFSKQSSLHLRGAADRRYPALHETNDALTQDDAWLWSSGKADLKPYTGVQTTLSYLLQKPKFSLEAYGYYRHFFHPVMDEVVHESGRFIQTYGNQKAMQECQIILSSRINLWKNYLALQLNPIFRHYVSRGNDYTHRSTSCSYTGTLLCAYKNWQLAFQMRNAWKDLWGEQLGIAQRTDLVMLSYRHNLWFFRLGLNEFLGRDYSHNKVEKLSALYHSYEQYAHPAKVVSVHVSFTLPFGKIKQSGKQRLNNQDDSSGVLKEIL